MKSRLRLKPFAEAADMQVMDSSTAPEMVGSFFDFGQPDNLEALLGTCAQLRSLLERWNDALERQKSELARQLHDDFVQQLTVISLELALLDRTLAEARPSETSPEVLRTRLQKLAGIVGSSIRSIRKLTTELQPKLLDEFGLEAAIRWQCQEFERVSGVECEFICSLDGVELNPRLATQIHRIVREALANVEQHAKATQVQIHLVHENGWLNVQIQDNGRGILDAEAASPHSLGLAEMRWRAESLGGTLKVNGIRDDGTLVALRLPTTKKTDETEPFRAVTEI